MRVNGLNVLTIFRQSRLSGPSLQAKLPVCRSLLDNDNHYAKYPCRTPLRPRQTGLRLAAQPIPSVLLPAKHTTGDGRRARRVKGGEFQTDALPAAEVAPTAGLRLRAIGQATFRLSADDLPVLRSATMS